MVWTAEHQKRANAEGWGIYDVATNKGMRFMALPLQFSQRCPNAEALQHAIVESARSRNALAMAALKHIASNGK